MTDFTEIDGVGPSRAEQLSGQFDSFEGLADADYEALAEQMNRLSEDKALSMIVQAQDLAEVDEEDSASEEESDDVLPSDIEDLATEDDEEFVEDVEEEDESVDDEPDTFDAEFEFTPLQYDLVVAALVQDVSAVYNSNPPRYNAGMNLLEQMRSQKDGVVEFTDLESQDINTMHSAVRQLRNHYQGTNVVEFMDELIDVENAVDEVRQQR
jgi:hypothetical protein